MLKVPRSESDDIWRKRLEHEVRSRQSGADPDLPRCNGSRWRVSLKVRHQTLDNFVFRKNSSKHLSGGRCVSRSIDKSIRLAFPSVKRNDL
jgi:hypothetical protein